MPKRCSGLLRPGLQMLACDVGIRCASVGADGAGEAARPPHRRNSDRAWRRPSGRAGWRASWRDRRGLRTGCPASGAIRRGVAVVGRGRRNMVAAKLRRAGGRGDQDARAGADRAGAGAASSSKATAAPMLCPKKANGWPRYGSMASASASTSGAMRSKGASASRDSRPGRRTGNVGNADRAARRRAAAGVRKPEEPGRLHGVDAGEPGGGRRPLAEAEGEQAALVSGESSWRPRLDACGGRAVAAATACGFCRADASNGSTRQIPRVLQRRLARSPRDLARSARGRSAAARAPRATVRYPAAAPPPPAPSARRACVWYFAIGCHRQQVRHSHLRFGNAADVGGHHRHAAQHRLQHDARTRLRPQRRHQQHARAATTARRYRPPDRAAARWAAPAAPRDPARWCPTWARRRNASRETRRPAPGRSRCLSPRRDSPA